MTSDRTPAVELRLSFVAADGTVCARHRLCWANSPSAAAFVAAVAARARDARRRGLTLRVEAASPGALTVLMAAGLCGPDGPLTVSDAVRP